MKVLLIGKENILRWLDYTKKAFEQSDTVQLATITTNKIGFFSDINRNLTKIFSKTLANQTTSHAIAKKIESFRPDLIFVISPFLLGDDILSALESSKATKVGWIGDKFGIEHQNTAQLFDYLYVTDTGFIELASNYNFPICKYLPLAVDTDIFCTSTVSRGDDLVFVGANTPERLELVQQIDYPQIKIYGKTWPNTNSKHLQFVKSNIDLETLIRLYQTSKYVLNVKHAHNVINGLNMRTFEAIACGGCILQDMTADVALNFDVNEEIVVYNNIAELNECLIKLEQDGATLKKVVQNAYKRVVSQHTYQHRIDTILKDLR